MNRRSGPGHIAANTPSVIWSDDPPATEEPEPDVTDRSYQHSTNHHPSPVRCCWFIRCRGVESYQLAAVGVVEWVVGEVGVEPGDVDRGGVPTCLSGRINASATVPAATSALRARTTSQPTAARRPQIAELRRRRSARRRSLQRGTGVETRMIVAGSLAPWRFPGDGRDPENSSDMEAMVSSRGSCRTCSPWFGGAVGSSD